MEENENNEVFYDYVKLEILYRDDVNDKWHPVPGILQLDDTITNVYVSDRNSKYTTITLCMSDADTDIVVETSKVSETFDIIYKSLKKLADDRYEDNKPNQVD